MAKKSTEVSPTDLTVQQKIAAFHSLEDELDDEHLPVPVHQLTWPLRTWTLPRSTSQISKRMSRMNSFGGSNFELYRSDSSTPLSPTVVTGKLNPVSFTIDRIERLTIDDDDYPDGNVSSFKKKRRRKKKEVIFEDCPNFLYWSKKVLAITVCVILASGFAFLFHLLVKAILEGLVDPSLYLPLSISIAVVFGLLLAVAFATSIRMKCIAVLTIPSLGTGRGRAVLLSMVIGLMMAGPAANTVLNIDLVASALDCASKETRTNYEDLVKEQFENVTRQYNYARYIAKAELYNVKKEMSSVQHNFAVAKEAVNESIEVVKSEVEPFARAAVGIADGLQAACFFCGDLELLPDLDVDLMMENIELPDLSINIDLLDMSMPELPDVLAAMHADLKEQNIEYLKDSMQTMFRKIFNQVEYVVFHARKLLYLSFLVMVFNCFFYSKKYCIDDDFDNRKVDNNVRQLWKKKLKKGREVKGKLLPLHSWERKRYYTQWQVTMTPREKRRVFLSLIPTLFTALVVGGIVFLDAMVYRGLRIALLVGEAIDSVSEAASDLTNCIPVPVEPGWTNDIIMGIMLVMCILSSFLEAYALRLRPRICDYFYPERAHDRAQQLLVKISSGRSQRRLLFTKMVKAAGKRIARTKRYALFKGKLGQHYRKFFKVTTQRCATCGEKNEIADMMAYDYENKHDFEDTRQQKLNICKDCWSDMNPGTSNSFKK